MAKAKKTAAARGRENLRRKLKRREAALERCRAEDGGAAVMFPGSLAQGEEAELSRQIADIKAQLPEYQQ